MKILIILFVLISQMTDITNTKWIVIRSFTPGTKEDPIEKSVAFNQFINEKVTGMEVHFTSDSVFMIDHQNIIDKGRIDSISDKDVIVLMGNGVFNKLKYEYGADNKELILTLPDGVKLYMEKKD